MLACATPLPIDATSDACSHRLDHEDQPSLGLAVALDVALGHSEMGVPSYTVVSGGYGHKSHRQQERP